MKIKHQIVLGSSVIFVVWILQHLPSPATENCVLELEDGSEVNMGELCNNADPVHQEQTPSNDNSKPDHRQKTSGNKIPSPWNEYCTVTFNQTYDLKYFGAQWFTAQPNHQYLFQKVFVGRDALLYALTEDGAYQFQVNLSQEEEVPFQSNCNSVQKRVSLDPEQRAKSIYDFKDYISVFRDVVVFSDETLSKKICTLEKGTTVPIMSGVKYGYETNNRIYKYYLNALSPQCGGREIGFVRAPELAEIAGQRVRIIPIGIIKKENQ